MAVDAAALIARYPELTAAYSAYPDMVDGCIEQAEAMTDSEYYGAKYEPAVKALAAHFVAINPLGEMARLDKRSDRTVYLIQYEQLRKSAPTGFRVL